MKYLPILLILTLFTLSSCEDVVDLNLKSTGQTQLNVDAWITDEQEEQKIVLTLSQTYFDNTAQIPALGAKVIVYGQDSVAHEFIDKKNNGNYTFLPTSANYLKLDEKVTLSIKYDGEEYISTSQLKRVPKIDSVSYEVYSLPIAPKKGPKDGFLSQFYAHDIVGEGDTYLIRYYKNDTLHFSPSEITLAYDAGFSKGSKTDGLLFILPLRQSITKSDNLWLNNDKLTVELFSIPLDAFNFITLARTESNNGGLFATPLSNISTNIVNRNTNSPKKPLGAFIVSKVSRYSTVIDKTKAIPKSN